jgi:hypothetical protein
LPNKRRKLAGRYRAVAHEGSRLAALAAVAALIALGTSDLYARQFWISHPETTAIASALIVVLVSATVIEVVLKQRSERRWRLLAQYALLELAEAAHSAWEILVKLFDNGHEHDATPDPSHIIQILSSPDRAPQLKQDVEALLTESLKREELRNLLEVNLNTSRGLISRWGVVLTGSSSYSELFDRHIEMIGRIHGLWYFLAYGVRRGNRFREPGGTHRDDWFVDNLLSMTHIAIRLEDETWPVALRVVPADWWDLRTDQLAAPAHSESN